MNTAGKIILVAGGLTAFYFLRKHADKKFAVGQPTPLTATTPSIIDTIQKILPAEIVPEPVKPSATTPVPVTATPTPTFQPVIEPTPIYSSPTATPTLVRATTLVQPKLTTFNTLDRKVYSLDQRAMDLAGFLR